MIEKRKPCASCGTTDFTIEELNYKGMCPGCAEADERTLELAQKWEPEMESFRRTHKKFYNDMAYKPESD